MPPPPFSPPSGPTQWLFQEPPAESKLLADRKQIPSSESQNSEEPAAKATYNRKMNRWKIYWMRADLKWHSYPPHPEAVFYEEFLAVVNEDENGCFWG